MIGVIIVDEKLIKKAIVLINNCIDVQEKSKRITHANISAINEDIKAYKIAIEALEKQLPKKPIFQHMIGEIKGKFKCPCCNNMFTHECPTFPYEDMEHCSKCG